MKLSKRLQKIADLVIKYKNGNILADIGCDHGYLPCFLVKNKVIEKAYGCDIASGPIDMCKETIEYYHLQDRVIPLIGDGMTPIVDKDVNMIIISGMGGILITDILNKYINYLNNYRFILQANTDVDILREYLNRNGFSIIDEQIVKDMKHYYEIIVCEMGNASKLSLEDITFGPILRNIRSDIYLEYWNKQLDALYNILDVLPTNHKRVIEINNKIKLIEREINNVS